MRKLSLLLLIFYSFNLFASDCQLKVTYVYKVGKDEVKEYFPKAKSKKECFDLKSLYLVNGDPKKIKEKKVEVKWKGK